MYIPLRTTSFVFSDHIMAVSGKSIAYAYDYNISHVLWRLSQISSQDSELISHSYQNLTTKPATKKRERERERKK